MTIEGSGLKRGDMAGLCLLQGDYAGVALRRGENGYEAVLFVRPCERENQMAQSADDTAPEEREKISLSGPELRVRLRADFEEMRDTARFYVGTAQGWRPLGGELRMYFKLDHFCGCRAGLFCYATDEPGGRAAFSQFTHTVWENDGRED